MPRYRVPLNCLVSTTVVVEADSPEDAIEEALTEGTPGLVFLNHTYPDEGEWYPATEELHVEAVSIEDAVTLAED